MDKHTVTDSFSPGFCEYLVPGNINRRIAAIRAFSVVFGIVLLVLLFQLLSFIPQVFAVWLVLIFALEIMVFRITKREFEYTVAMGELVIYAIYGKRWRKKLVSLRVADADTIFPVTSFKDEQISRLKAQRVIFASPKKSDFMYCLLTKDTGGKNSKTAVVFSSCKKLNDALKFYNRAALTERN